MERSVEEIRGLRDKVAEIAKDHGFARPILRRMNYEVRLAERCAKSPPKPAKIA